MTDQRGSIPDRPAGFAPRWVSRPRLIALFWTAAVIALAAMAYAGAVGWDAKGYWKAVQSVQHNSDPYAEDIVALQAFHQRLATNPAEPRPFVYVYSPLTLPLLRLLGMFPASFVGLLYGLAVAVGAAIQLWAGFQMADQRERPWLMFVLPAVVFFPGLVCLSGGCTLFASPTSSDTAIAVLATDNTRRCCSRTMPQSSPGE